MVPLALLCACKGPPPAPKELEELIGWMYTHVADEETADLEEGTVNLESWMGRHLDETLEGYTVDVLTPDQIESLGVGERDLDGLVGVAVGYEHITDLDEIAAGLMLDPTERSPDLYVDYSYDEIEGTKDCFEEGSCDWVDYTSYAYEHLGLDIYLTINSRLQFRRYDTEVGQALVYRYWTTENPTVTTELFALDQSYFLWAFVPHDGGYLSMQASWVVARVLADDLDSGWILNLWVDGMIKGAGELDETAH
jgi:hypothetical protein